MTQDDVFYRQVCDLVRTANNAIEEAYQYFDGIEDTEIKELAEFELEKIQS